MIPSTIAGLVSILSADAEIQALVSSGSPLVHRIYGYELKRSESDNQPRKAIVLRPASGEGLGNYTPVLFPFVDVLCYGETFAEAEKVSREAHNTLYQLDRTVDSDRMIWSCEFKAGLMAARDPDTDWPMTWETWRITSSRVSAA